MRSMIIGTVAVVLAGTVSLGAQLSTGQRDRIRESASVLDDMHADAEKDIPQLLWERARCVIVIPNLKKIAFVFGGEYGKGMMSCRREAGWSAPVFMELEKGSWGAQIGGESIDLVLLVMHQRGMDKLLENKTALGGDASIAAGPIGRTAQASTDAQLSAEIVSYSRSQGLFVGIDLSGGVLKADVDANRRLYGERLSPREVLSDGTKAPVEADAFMVALGRQPRRVAEQ